ncbi:YraN family protein [Oleiharenicola lentus]|uniref:YraN family protein n=1 Tax=Oleiharenicola lentus TaxID=2508720 RepID=UPI003F664D4A
MFRPLKDFWKKLTARKNATGRAADGARGEEAAADFLKARRNFSVVTRNWRNPRDHRDEIDLVCRDGDTLVFVEVKARAAGALVPGYHAVDDRKKRALRRAVHVYLAQLSHAPKTFRFDVAEVTLHPQLPPQVLHFENVQLFPKGYYVARQSGSLGEMGGGGKKG